MQLTDAASPSSRRHRRGDRSPPFARVARPDPAMPGLRPGDNLGTRIRTGVQRPPQAGPKTDYFPPSKLRAGLPNGNGLPPTDTMAVPR